jgi:hypothetical protein
VVQAAVNPRRSFNSFPATCAPGIGFRNQCERWWRKQFHKSVSRPEIPENFRRMQTSSFTLKNPRDFQRSGLRRAVFLINPQIVTKIQDADSLFH